MAKDNWMLYGASGFTAQLALEVALARGHQPLLAGRTEAKIKPLAEQHGLPYRIFSLQDGGQVAQHLEGVHTVVHGAGPYHYTYEPMVKGCLQAGANYIDITGEGAIIMAVLGMDAEAKAAGVALCPASGYDVVPTDCLALWLKEQLPDATELELAILPPKGSLTQGTAKTMLDNMPRRNVMRRVNGKFVNGSIGERAIGVEVAGKTRLLGSAPLGDLVTAYASTGIPTISTYMRMAPATRKRMKTWMPLVKTLTKSAFIRKLGNRYIEKNIKGPDEQHRLNRPSQVWGRVKNGQGKVVEAWLQSLEPYRMTGELMVRAVEKLQAEPKQGAFPPSLAYGRDFIMELPDTERHVTQA